MSNNTSNSMLEDVTKFVQLPEGTVELIKATAEYGEAVDALVQAENGTAEWQQLKLFSSEASKRLAKARKALGYD